MTIKHILTLATVVGLSFSSVSFAAEKADARLDRQQLLDPGQPTESPAATPSDVPQRKRSVALPVLYAALGTTQAWDLYSTSAALHAGAVEANPTAAPFARNAGAMLGLKVATTASAIFFAERIGKKNKAAAIAMMIAVTGATAAISMHNMHNAKIAGRAR